MRRLLVLGLGISGLLLAGCTGGAAGDPDDDIGDIFVVSHSPGNGDELDKEDSVNGFNALDNITLVRRGSVSIVFSNTLDLTSVINTDPADPQGSRNVRLFYFDTEQGPFDPTQPKVLGVNPPGANVIVPATTQPDTYNSPNDMLKITPSGISLSNPLPNGQYSVTVQTGVRGADGDGMKGAEYFFFFRVGQDTLGPTVVSTSPLDREKNVEPDREIRITMSETIRASTVTATTLQVFYQPAGVAQPIYVPGFFYTDGGNGPGNNFPNIQLDSQGLPGRSGVSPRNGADIVFRPDTNAFPVNMTAEDWQDPNCPTGASNFRITDPPRKGNTGFPLGQTITVNFIAAGVSDTAGNKIPVGSPLQSFTFETKSRGPDVFSPNNTSAVYYGDTVGVGVIDLHDSPALSPQIRPRPYLTGPNPIRPPNSVVKVNVGKPNEQAVRVPVNDLVDMTTDTRPYSAFYSFDCGGGNTSFYMPVLYAASGAVGGGQIVVVDTYEMVAMGRFGTPSPGGVALTAIGTTPGNSLLTVSNFSANTVSVYDISNVRFFTGATLWAQQGFLQNAVAQGQSKLVLSERDFKAVFPHQKATDLSSPPGPPLIGTINVGVSPSKVRITGLPASLGSPGFPCYSPYLSINAIVCALNAGENTADFTELQRLNQQQAIEPDLPGITLSSQPTDVAWAPYSTSTGSYYFFITSVGGTVELFASGQLSFTRPSVRPGSATNFAPNKIINSVSGLDLPSTVQWITSGSGATQGTSFYTHSVLVAETGENRLVELDVTSEVPSNLFQMTIPNLAAGLGPVDIAGDPWAATFIVPCGPRFVDYFVANAGEGNVRLATYQGGIISATIPVPGVVMVVSWWSR